MMIVRFQKRDSELKRSSSFLRHCATSLLILVLCVMTTGDLQAQQPDHPPGVQIITADDIAQAGLGRLSDLFMLIDDWHATSVEGYSWEVSANGLASAQESAWILLVDGNPVDLRVLDWQNINTLPLALGEIDYVEVHNTPTFIAGIFAQAGVIHLHTRTPDSGISLQADFAAGNETGDPGPFRYTPFSSPNIDRLGPTIQGALAVGNTKSHLRVYGKIDEHHATDERIRPRVLTFYQGEKDPRLILTSGGMDLSTTGRLGQHTVYAGVARYQDLPFFKPVGLETPTDHRFYHVGLQGDSDPGRPTGISYRLSYATSQLEHRNNKGAVDLDWRQETLRGNYEVRAARGAYRGALGLSIDLIQSRAAQALDDETLTLPRAYSRFGARLNDQTDATLTAYLSRAAGQLGYGALATVHITPTPIQTISLVGSFARQPFQEKNRLWYWIGEGYTFRARREVDITMPTSYVASTTYTVDLAWRIRPMDRVGVTLSGGYRRFDNQTLAAYTFRYDSLTTGFFADTDVSNTVFGRVIKGGVDATMRLIPSLRQRLHYTYLRYPTSDDLFFQAWRSQPWHRLSYTVQFAPNPRFSLYGRLTYYSETQWTAFLEAARDAGTRYEATLPGYWLLDLATQKRFWHDHLQLSLSVRNFRNEPYRAHPAGALINMTFHVRLQFYFNRGGKIN